MDPYGYFIEEECEKQIMCQQCASYAESSQNNKCCQIKKFLNLCCQNILNDAFHQTLKSFIQQVYLKQNQCEEHGYYFEFMICLNDGDQYLGCKQCIVTNFTKHQPYIEKFVLIDETYLEEEKQNIEKKFKELQEKINKEYDQKEKYINYQGQLQLGLQRIIYKNLQPQLDKAFLEKYIAELMKGKNCLEDRMRNISQLVYDDEYHQFMHDEYLEKFALRQAIMDKYMPNRKAFRLDKKYIIYMNNNRQLKSRPSQKLNQSFDYFKSTKVSTCTFVQKRGNDFVANPFYYRPKQKFEDYLNKSMYTTSTSQDNYSNQRACHSSMKYKPLSPYNPNALRNRLAPVNYKTNYGNKSQIEIGDQQLKIHKQYLTTYSNHVGNFGSTTPCSNPQILAERARWNHRQKQC